MHGNQEFLRKQALLIFLGPLGLLGWMGFGAVFSLGASSVVASEAPRLRRVIEGDLIYSTQAWARTEHMAWDRALRRAARLMAVECAVPPKEARVYRHKVSRALDGYTAEVDLGVPIADCEEARNAPPASHSRLGNPVLLAIIQTPEPEDRPIFEPGSGQSGSRPAQAQALSLRPYTPEELARAEKAIEARIAPRLALRGELRRSR